MPTIRIEKTRDYTVMANHHLRNKALSLKAKGLLSYMLSLPEDWNYTLSGLATSCKDGLDSVRQAVSELESHGYVVRSRVRDARGRLRDTEYVVYESPVPVKPALDEPIEAKPAQEEPVLENPTLESPALGDPTLLNTNRPTIQKPKTQIQNTQEPIPHPSNPYPINHSASLRETVRENIGYDVLVHDERFGKERLDEIVDLITETLCSSRETISVAGDDYPAELVKDKLMRLNSLHIEYVFECLENNTTHVRNIKKYMLAVLFNAPGTISHYYDRRVQHDLYSR